MHTINTNVIRGRSNENLSYKALQHKNFQIYGIFNHTVHVDLNMH